MGRLYTVQFTGVTVSAAQDLFEITAASTQPLRIVAMELGQLTETGDTAEEMLSLLFRRGVGATSGSGGTTATAVKTEPNQNAAGFVAEVNNTTRMTGGTITTQGATAWNERMSPCVWDWIGREWFVGAGDRFTVELSAAPADALTMSGTLWVEELG